MGTTVWNGMLGLLLPRGCAGCDKPDEVLCPDCRALFREHVTLPLLGSATGTGMAAGMAMSTTTSPVTNTAANMAAGPAMNTAVSTETSLATNMAASPAAKTASPEMNTAARPVTITAGGIYQGRVRRAILSWKDHGDAEYDKAFSLICRELVREAMMRELTGDTARELTREAVRELTRDAAASGITTAAANAASIGIPGHATCTGIPGHATSTGMSGIPAQTPTQILVVPAPSSPQSMRARGRRHLWPLAKAIASELAYGGAESCAVNALGISRVHGKAVETNNASGRAARLKERLEVADPGLIAGKSVLILDDIVTTGTTMRRCAEAIRGAGGQVIGGIALAAVPPPGEL